MALAGARRALLSGRPWWRAAKYLADGQYPSAIADYRNNRYMLLGSAVPFSAIHAFTASSSGAARTYVGQDGLIKTDVAVDQPRFDWSTGLKRLLLENAATNLLLNSATLSTQSVTTSAQSYTLSFYGTGSVTLSGTATGTLNGVGSGRVTLTVTATAGTLTATVTGTVSNAQIESGSFASSYIPTTSAAVTRAIETAQFTVPVFNALASPASTVLVQGGFAAPALTGTIIGGALSQQQVQNNDAVSARSYNGSTAYNASFGTGSMADYGIGLAADAAGSLLCGNGGTPVANAQLAQYATTAYLARGGIAPNASGPQYGNGGFNAVLIYTFKLSAAAIRQKAMPYAA